MPIFYEAPHRMLDTLQDIDAVLGSRPIVLGRELTKFHEEFLRVATSRAQAMVIVVGSPNLLEPECRSPRQMQLANALCRYVELAQVADRATQATGGN